MGWIHQCQNGIVRHEGGGKAKGKEKERSVRDDSGKVEEEEEGNRRQKQRSNGWRGWSKLMYVHTTSDLGTIVSGQEVNYYTVLNKAC